ncbi:hypothetical protein B0A52_02675 [Exophiala mesophila]|uniref:Uncharacterized protein n=1 Tax=Exophiala mesophila TaxID=212818 RepID=A0A438NDQ1_EXOME|nr:hypothetical protein B0A52_02675 [Exophiala mesophila]
MKDTLRKTRSKIDHGNEFDVSSDLTFHSSESHSPNPWASENSSAVNGEDIISRQVSKTSKSTGTTSPNRNFAQSQSPSPAASRLEPPVEAAPSADEPAKVTRRRKTVTKTPHTFELETDLHPPKPKEQLPPPEPPKQEPVMASPAPKKKKRVSSVVPPVDGAAAGAPAPSPVQSTTPKVVPIVQQPPTPTTKSAVAPVLAPAPAPAPATAREPNGSSSVSSPTSAKSPTPGPAPVNPFTSTRPKKSLSTSAPLMAPNPCRFTPPPLPQEAFHGKVIVITNGASQIGQSVIRQLHSAGCRVIFGDTNADQARKFISSLGPPHVVHFNKVDMTRYADMLELFKLAVTMYGRVDHAIFNVGDDGGQACTVGEGERGWFEDRTGVNKTPRMAYSEVEKEPSNLGDVLTASLRFARIALAYLKYSPKGKARKKPVNPFYTPPPVSPSDEGKDDRSLTFVTSIAAFKEMPLLPIYQVTQHSILGLIRSLRTTVDPDPERDGVRINAVATNIMVPRAVAQSGGRMSVQLPPDRPEDVGRVIVGVLATNSSTPSVPGGDTGISNGGGIWYEKGFERGMREKYLHGRILYSVGSESWDIQEGLDRSENIWVGGSSSEALARGMAGLGITGRMSGSESSWILDLA